MLVQNVLDLHFIGLPPGKTFSFDARFQAEAGSSPISEKWREFYGNHWKSGNFQFSTLRYFESISNCVSSIYCLC